MTASVPGRGATVHYQPLRLAALCWVSLQAVVSYFGMYVLSMYPGSVVAVALPICIAFLVSMSFAVVHLVTPVERARVRLRERAAITVAGLTQFAAIGYAVYSMASYSLEPAGWLVDLLILGASAATLVECVRIVSGPSQPRSATSS